MKRGSTRPDVTLNRTFHHVSFERFIKQGTRLGWPVFSSPKGEEEKTEPPSATACGQRWAGPSSTGYRRRRGVTSLAWSVSLA